ncbi:MAG: Fe(3+) ABC transporter substrate-binding protein [Pseudomonadota bacterium]
MKKSVSLPTLVLSLITLFWSGGVFASGQVNVYSARHYDTDLQLYAQFEAQTGIKVNLIEAASDALIERIVNEGKYSPADILITVDAGRLFRATERDLFSPFVSEVLSQRVPEHLRHPDGLWYGLSKRARVIIYNEEQGKPQGLNDYADLADPKFKGQICVRSSSNIYNISLMASLVTHLGEQGAEEWAQGVVANLLKKPQGNDTANIRSVSAGECYLSIVNSYYLARFIASGNSAAEGVGLIFPGQESNGTHVNISGAGILKHAPNRENAIKFIEYLTEPQAQTYFTEGNHEYPVVQNAKSTATIENLGSFKEDTINASLLGENQATAVKIFDRAGWR